MSSPSPADWQLPPGVSRGLWEYLHNPAIARNYDASLADSILSRTDEEFVHRHCSQPGRLLDLGCGTGRLLLTFARRGYWVLGVDLSMDMLKVARDKATKENAIVHLVRANLVELAAIGNECFDYAACLFSTLGMIVGEEQRAQFLRHVYRILRPGGKFILHVHNRWFNCWNPRGRRWLWRNTLDALLGRAEAGDCVMPVHQGVANLRLHLYSRREVCRVLRGTGFQVLEVQPLSLCGDGRLQRGWWFGWLRAYGYLVVAERP